MPMYRRMEFTLRSLVVLAALLALLTGRAGAESPKASGGGEADDVITLWQAFRVEETAVFREVMDEFQKDYKARTGKTIRVELQYVSFDDMFTKLRTAALARITPDVAFMDSIKVTDLAFGQAVVPVEDLKVFKERYGTREKASEEFVSAAFNSGVVDRLGVKKLYALPVQTTTVALFWNKEMFRNKSADLRAAGLDPNRAPQDWDELIAYGKVLTDSKRGVYAIGLSSSLWFNFGIFNMYGVDFIQYQADGRANPAINTPNGAAALNRIQSIINSGVEGGAVAARFARAGTDVPQSPTRHVPYRPVERGEFRERRPRLRHLPRARTDEGGDRQPGTPAH
jgi:ABC-type glycerol-3-phosphate transport system substrate-binding protein